jgi:hypothetical protein
MCSAVKCSAVLFFDNLMFSPFEDRDCLALELFVMRAPGYPNTLIFYDEDYYITYNLHNIVI